MFQNGEFKIISPVAFFYRVRRVIRRSSLRKSGTNKVSSMDNGVRLLKRDFIRWI